MSILGLNGVNTYINAAGRNLLGFESDEQVSTTSIAQYHAPEHHKLITDEVLPTVMGKGKWTGTILVRHLATGEIFPVFKNCMRIDDPVSGEPIAIGVVMRDLRPELAAKQALANSEQFLRNIMTAAPTALWTSDKHGNIAYVNQTWIDWTGRTFEDNIGYGWLNAVVGTDRKSVADIWARNFTDRKWHEVEFRIHHSDGSVH